ncbi:DUF4105 domain-containing protein [Pseudorhodobacter ferrugineus]|uniref:Lnb N-terminal periplasmic domain-containing protein n=1 Tax=Pseudorhodobacter ferrugineus TaxID=77008 RepID=UPI0003B4E2B8|nr:DUF4105 domain-containing protein [Pseudorhodobacter ferrugineus]
MERFFKLLGRGLQLTAAFGLLLWAVFAVHYQLKPPFQMAGIVAIAGTALVILFLSSRGKWRGVWRWMGLSALVIFGWWYTITPRSDRDWMVDVSRGVTAEPVAGGLLVKNIRNFDWTSETDATAAWYDATVNPDDITSVDMLLSTWGNPDIAHAIVSFGFKTGQHIAFSVETRKEVGETYSTLGGFFRLYELTLIAADERDIARLRTDLRGETVSLYPIDLTLDQRKALFMSYIDFGSQLAAQPAWYNTLTTNCTTVPYFMVAEFSNRVTLDRRMMLPGRLPEYLHELGVLAKGQDMAQVRTRARLGALGPVGPDSAAFSKSMRRAWVTP